MDSHKLTELLPDAESTHLERPTPEIKVTGGGDEINANGHPLKIENSPIINVQIQNHVLSVPRHSWRAAASSDSDWRTTTDTSVHSSPSAADLEACDGLDDASFSSVSPATPARGRGRGRAPARGRGRAPRGARGGRHDSSSSSSSYDSASSSSFDTDSNSDTSRSGSSGSGQSSSSNSCSSGTGSSHSTCSSYCNSSCECSCSCHSDGSSTSYESTDDLTDVPRSKRGARLGPRGSRKVADKCTQC